MIDYAHIAELAFMGILNVVASMAAIRARLNALDKRVDNVAHEAERANERIDAILIK